MAFFRGKLALKGACRFLAAEEQCSRLPCAAARGVSRISERLSQRRCIFATQFLARTVCQQQELLLPLQVREGPIEEIE